MKLYSKIAGTLLTLTGATFFALLVFAIFDTSRLSQKVELSFFFVPLIIFMHYMYIHNFGFSFKSEIPKKNYRIIIFLTIASLLVSIAVPAMYLSNQISIEKDAAEMEKAAAEMIERELVGVPNDLDITVKTKYSSSSGEMLYNVKLITKDNSIITEKYTKFILVFTDKDGFNVLNFELKEGAVSVVDKNSEKTRIIGKAYNSKKSISLEDYMTISYADINYYSKD